jgi:hypothetical protein
MSPAQARRLALEELKHLAAPELTAQRGTALGVNTVQLENRLRQIDPDCGNIVHGWLPLLVMFTAPNMAHCDAGSASHPLHQWRPQWPTASSASVKSPVLASGKRSPGSFPDPPHP